jgi:hypothetical protein
MVLTRHLYRRLMRKWRVIGLITLASVPGFVYWLAAFDADADELAGLYSDIIAFAGYSFVIAALILTVATLREERDAGTLPYIYMRPMPRVSLAISSMLAAIGAVLAIAFGGWLTTALATVALGADISIALPGLALFAVAGIGYAAVFVPLGYLVPRSLLVGLGYIIVIETILASAVPGLAQFSIWRIALSIYADLAPVFGDEAAEALGPLVAGVGGGVAKIAGTVIVGLLVLTWALRKRDAL